MSAESTSPAERSGGWRLAGSPSAYLRSAHEQPIEWYPWGEEAFEAARRTNRPILLDIGAVWCHWCHVMDEGTYSDPEVARLIAQHFVAVKVDRDETPEVDRRYQREVNALSGEGGWPLTAFLTPKGEVFFGGTYFPPQEGLGRPGFRHVLKELARLWREEPEKIAENTRAVGTALAHEGHGTGRPEALSRSTFLAAVREALASSFDPVNGGFGVAPKFPHPTAVEYLLWATHASGDEAPARQALETLRKMADGGLFDQLAGGFHRYSVDEGWHVPHFEKMGADNSALLSAFVAGFRYGQEPRLLEVVGDTVGWIRTTLEDPQGGFGASQDADNAPGDDGGYYTWTRTEMRSALDAAEFRLATRYFGVGSEGRMPHDPDRNVLFRLMSLGEAAEGTGLDEPAAERALGRAVEKLRAARARRPPPTVDHALYANLNGGFVKALVGASEVLGDPAIMGAARAAADRFLERAFRPDRGVAHRLDPDGPRGWGHLEDHAEFAWGLVELAGATVDRKYLDAASTLYELTLREFHAEGMPLRDLAPSLYDGPSLGSLDQPAYPVEDQPNLSANAAVLLGLLRLNSLTSEERWRTEAEQLLTRVLPRLERAGLFGAGAAVAAGLLETTSARVVVEGSDAGAASLLRTAYSAWHPNRWVFRGTPPSPFSVPEELAQASAAPAGASRALVCWGNRCAPPVNDPAELRKLLMRGSTAGGGT